MNAVVTSRARALAATVLVAASALLAGCADDVAQPTPLEPLEPKIAGHQVQAAKAASTSVTVHMIRLPYLAHNALRASICSCSWRSSCCAIGDRSS